MIVRSRGYLPHIEIKKTTYFVTFRLAGSMPAEVLELWRSERKDLEHRAGESNRETTAFEQQELARLYSDRIEEYLDSGADDCWLKNPEVAKIVSEALRHFDGTLYELHAWCIMPNHVHVIVTPVPSSGKYTSDLIPILHSWKSYSSHEANKILKRNAKFWQEEYYDHRIRNES
jgi:REP element-mobilizing transposase RayT